MMRRAAEAGAAYMSLNCMADNASATSTYFRAGFAEVRRYYSLEWRRPEVCMAAAWAVN
jgi:hypothetical protein